MFVQWSGAREVKQTLHMPKQNKVRNQPRTEALSGLTTLSVPGRHPARKQIDRPVSARALQIYDV